MGKRLDITNEIYGRLTALYPDKDRKRNWICSCQCGNKKSVALSNLRNGNTKSCGCIAKEVLTKRNKEISYVKTHGLSQTKEYMAWQSMLSRCLSPDTTEYKNYGARGITVHQPWIESFEVFLNDMGQAPCSKASLDRIDNEGNYEPGNVRWVKNQSIQKVNQRKNSRNTSGTTGVYKCKNKWRACITLEGKFYNLGCFDDKQDAIIARQEAEVKLFRPLLQSE